MNSRSVGLLLLLSTTTFLFVNGDWLSNLRRFEQERRDLPSIIVLNKEVKQCGTLLSDYVKCGCQALLCNGERTCEHTTSVVGGYKYKIQCDLLKPWHEIDLLKATAGGETADCSCRGQAIKVVKA